MQKPITDDFIERIDSGVWLHELRVTTKKREVEKLNRFIFRIVLVQGLNRQIRRICELLGYDVIELQAERVYEPKIGKPPARTMARPDQSRVEGFH